MTLPTIRVASTLLCLVAPALAAPPRVQPTAPLRPVVDTYFGTNVVDNYRYMERLSDPEVAAWMKQQAAYTASTLSRIRGRNNLLADIARADSASVSRRHVVRRGDRYFYLETSPGAPVARLCVRDGLSGESRVLVDPTKLDDGSPAHHSIDFISPSWDGNLVAYGVAVGGSESDTLRVVDVRTGKTLPEAISRASDSVLSWRPDNRSFFYMRYPKPTPTTPESERDYNATTALHALDSDPSGDSDAVVFGHGVSPSVDVPEGEGTWVVETPGCPYLLAFASHNMDGNPAAVFVAPVDSVASGMASWHRVATAADGVLAVAPHGDSLYLLTIAGTPKGRLVSVPLANPDLSKAKVILPEGIGVLNPGNGSYNSLDASSDALYLREQVGVVSTIIRIPFDTLAPSRLPFPSNGSASVVATDPRLPGAVVAIQNWVTPPTDYAFDPPSGKLAPCALTPKPKFDPSRFKVEETFVVSHDGTLVPLSIVSLAGKALDGRRPTILLGYGNYGISFQPTFMSEFLPWVARGGVLAVAHVRGGGELGAVWHAEGQKLKKLNTIFDFIACGQHLVDAGYTVPHHLAAMGGSAGGITVGMAMDLRPDLFGVVLDDSGMADTLRVETEPNGPTQTVEFGSLKTRDGFRSLYAMSPYLHIRNGVRYPAVLLCAGANDPRVAPWHSAKMAARLQTATTSHRPVLFRVDYNAGHGAIGVAASQRQSLLADQMAFALWQMGEPGFSLAR